MGKNRINKNINLNLLLENSRYLSLKYILQNRKALHIRENKFTWSIPYLNVKNKAAINFMDENLKKIKETILEIAKEMNVEIDRIVLFGSRARGDYRKDSDYDLLIVTKEKLDKERLIEFFGKIKVKLAKLHIPNDIVIKSLDSVMKEKEIKYTITSVAIEEGQIVWMKKIKKKLRNG